ncbi:MAG TPA: sulfite exporter TauE/SafE family protein, partial [Phenylobacterium sp.]|nr:sulfite exporter TauE/SafE family protein [Phenylobacterium sp.]
VFAHLAKVLVYGAPLLASGTKGLPAVWVFALAIPLSMLGTVAGGRILDRMSDVNFKRWTRWIVTAVGISYLVQAAQLMLAR